MNEDLSQTIAHLVRPDRSKFYGPCIDGIDKSKQQLLSGWTIQVQLPESGGYDGDVILRIGSTGDETFQTSWSGSDPTRFPARIKAAATALRDSELVGTFAIRHIDGTVCIAPPEPRLASPGPIVAYEAPASPAAYEAGFRNLEEHLSDTDRAVLGHHYSSPNQTITAGALADALGYDGYSPANSAYGRLGRKVGEALSVGPFINTRSEEKWWPVLAHGVEGAPFQWVLRSEVARALEKLGYVEEKGAKGQFVSVGQAVQQPCRVAESPSGYTEGKEKTVTSTRYERDEKARASCIAYYGARCCICGFDFEETYGPAGKGYIHVHHEVPVAEREGTYQVDPIKDLKPVCPNCHAIIHLGDQLLSVDEVRDLIAENSR